MRPYFLAGINLLRVAYWKLKNSNVCVNGPILMNYNTKFKFGKGSKISIEGHFVSDGRLVIITGEKGVLSIREHVYFNEDGMISCQNRVTIGCGCKFGPNVKIIDNNHHFSAEEGVSDSIKVGEVFIGDHCWIGSNAVILKGAVIGDNCVIGAGCVIDAEIPPRSVVTQQRILEIKPMR